MKFKNIDAEFARKLRDHFYVDGLNLDSYNVESGFDLYKKVKINLLIFSFNVRYWRTNSESLRILIYNCEKSFYSENFTTVENEKVVTWNEKGDVLIFGLRDMFNAAVNITPTKRNILSVIACVYSRIGYMQPIVINLKLLFQEICLLSVSWDEIISEQLLQKCMVIMESWRKCTDFEIKRCYYIYDFNDPVESFYLHDFSDSSLIGYGTCVYLKAVTKSGNIYVLLLASKSRIVPAKKKFTIPKLELLGNFLLSNLINVIYNALSEDIAVTNYFCWSHSFIPLAWIKNVNKEYKLFIQNWAISIRKFVHPSL